MKMEKAQLVAKEEVKTRPEVKQLKKTNPEHVLVKALYKSLSWPVAQWIDEEMAVPGPDCSLLCWWCQNGPSWVT